MTVMINLESKDWFEAEGYTVVKNALSNPLLDFVTQYALFDEMQDYEPDDSQVIGAHAKYADPAMETLLLHLHPIMEQSTGLKLHPTYSFFRIYRNGDELKIHKDRPSCEISCTLCFNHSYSRDEYKWPIYVAGNPADLQPGDMVIYRGCDLDHWREPMNAPGRDDWHVQGFFHYVNAYGPYSQYKYDYRPSIGEPRHKQLT